jgi:hypothetical protein
VGIRRKFREERITMADAIIFLFKQILYIQGHIWCAAALIMLQIDDKKRTLPVISIMIGVLFYAWAFLSGVAARG